jgi:membrane-bound ClpP family serine protease
MIIMKTEEQKMSIKEGFMGGFLVFGFAIFIVGFLTGMLAFIMMPLTPNSEATVFIIFVFGFITGMVTIALVWVSVRLTRLTKKPSYLLRLEKRLGQFNNLV